MNESQNTKICATETSNLENITSQDGITVVIEVAACVMDVRAKGIEDVLVTWAQQRLWIFYDKVE